MLVNAGCGDYAARGFSAAALHFMPPLEMSLSGRHENKPAPSILSTKGPMNVKLMTH